MRALLSAVIALAALAAMPGRAAAVDYPWCVHYSMEGDVANCGFVSFEQCRMTASGNAGFCQLNPFYVAAHSAKAKPAARRSRRH